MRSIKNIVIAASAVAAVCTSLIVKHLNEKKAAEQKATFEQAETESQAQQDERSAAVKQHNEELLKSFKENRANMERAWRIEEAVIELEKKFDSARRVGNASEYRLYTMINELNQFAKELDEIAATGNDYFKKDVAVARTRDKINEAHDDIMDHLFKEKKEA